MILTFFLMLCGSFCFECFAAEESRDENDSTLSIRNDTLEKKLFDGQFEEVIDETDRLEEQGYELTFETLNLKAIASRERFIKYFSINKFNGRWPREEEAEELKRKSEQTTKAFEQAFAAASCSLEKARLSTEWWKLNGRNLYASDSSMLRSMENSDDLEYRNICAEKLYEACYKLLSIETQGKLDEDEKVRIASAFKSEYLKLSKTGVPKEKFEDLLSDLPLFIQFYFPLEDAKLSDEYAVKQARWYLWHAIVRNEVSKIEKRLIDQQVKEFAKHIEKSMNEVLEAGNSDKKIGKAYADRFVDIYNRTKDNSFIPLFKKALFDYQISSVYQDIEEDIESYKSRHAKDYRWVKANYDKADIKSGLAEVQAQSCKTVYDTMFYAFAANCRPISTYVPGEIITSCSGTINQFDLYVFSIGRSKEVPEYPARKRLRP